MDDGRDATTDAGEASAAETDDPPRRVEVYPGKEVVVEFDPELTFECVEDCTWCCHHGVLLYDRDLIELAARANLSETTTDFRAEKFVVREEKGRDEHVADDGMACAFLGDDGLCELHLADERDWKPTRCSVFPLAVEREDGELHVDVRDSAREHCEGLGVSERRVIEELEAFLPELLWELENPDSDRIL
ncbi:YkgJ family cysteine cluster protein [Halovivax sp.]|uniref:YkgJ family cysteine cluster protein n=1 Tax=Halovivax sp. TaxID=1935978 RepID=UPI0025C40A3C|nr:YkgJ family cysteine cluster protein [Halovivax sp.]